MVAGRCSATEVGAARAGSGSGGDGPRRARAVAVRSRAVAVRSRATTVRSRAEMVRAGSGSGGGDRGVGEQGERRT